MNIPTAYFQERYRRIKMEVNASYARNTTSPPTNDTYNHNPANHAETAEWVANAIVGPIFVIVGVPGNVLSFLVWSRKSTWLKRSSTALYLTVQSAVDIGVLAFFCATYSPLSINPGLMTSHSYAVFFSYIGYPLTYFFTLLSIWMNVGVTVDRYVLLRRTQIGEVIHLL